MPRIFRYPDLNSLSRPLEVSDLLVGSDGDSSDITKAYPISQVTSYVEGENLLVDLGADSSAIDVTEVSVTGGGPVGGNANTLDLVNHVLSFSPGFFSEGYLAQGEVLFTLSGDYPIKSFRFGSGNINIGLFSGQGPDTGGDFDILVKDTLSWNQDNSVKHVVKAVAISSSGDQFVSINSASGTYNPALTYNLSLWGQLLNSPGLGISTLTTKASAIWVFKKQV